MNLKLETVQKDYEKLKQVTKKELDKKNYNDCLNIISCASNIAYHLNFKFYDDTFEDYLKIISSNLIKNTDFIPISGRWVFYDYFGLDNRGLTQQYLNVLEDLGVEFMYILENYIDDNNHSDILNQLHKNDKATVYINNNKLDIYLQISNLQKEITKYAPEKALLHLAPWSCLSILLWNNLNKIERYFINLTDHAFWLGKNTFDYCIELREYGMYFSNKFRKIEKNKLLLSHFYPIILKKEFLGFPKEVENKIKIFSGGAYYKVYGSNGLYFDIVKKILLKYDNTVLLFAGSGNEKPFKDFIIKNNFQNRIFLLGHRSDINEVIQNSDIYLNTYPLGGGLITQYALLNNIPVISYAEKELPMSFTETMTYKKGLKCTYTDLNTFFKQFDFLIENYKNTKIDASLVSPSREDFYINFKKIINEKKSNLEVKDFHFVEKRFQELYFDTENNYLKQYDLIKFKWLGLKYFKYDFFCALISAIKILINHRKLALIKIIKKLGIKNA